MRVPGSQPIAHGAFSSPLGLDFVIDEIILTSLVAAQSFVYIFIMRANEKEKMAELWKTGFEIGVLESDVEFVWRIISLGDPREVWHRLRHLSTSSVSREIPKFLCPPPKNPCKI